MATNKKEYRIKLKYDDGRTEDITLMTEDISWSMEQLLRNRPFSKMEVQFNNDGKEEKEQRNVSGQG
jgi:predicted phosphohydrolase